MSDIDYSKFYLSPKNRAPARHRQRYIDSCAEENRNPFAPVPIYPGEPFNPDNPHFKSIRDLVKYVRKTPGYHASNGLKTDSEDYTTNSSWAWGFNMNSVLALYDKGWTDGFQAVKYDMEKAVSAAMLATMTESGLVRDIHGASIDIGAFIQGDPECMFEFRDEAKPVLHIELELDQFFSCGVPADEVMHRGICVMAAVMALRRMGVFVTMYTSMKVRHSALRNDYRRSQVVTNTRVDLMRQDLTENLSEVLLALAHPGFYRNIMFEAFAFATGNTDQSFGRTARTGDDFIPVPGSGKIVIPGQSTDLDSSELGIDWSNSWASPDAAAGMVRMILSAASTRR